MSDYTQRGRPFRLDTVLDEDVLLLNGFNGVEALSRPFGFQLDLLSTDAAVDPAGLLRQPALLTVHLDGGERRLVHGFFSRLTQLGMQDDLAVYRAELVPWLWFLRLSRDSRIFQDMTVPEIVEDTFTRLGWSDFELRLSRSYSPRLYCVQYRESHFDFVSRLLEDEGIYYFFEHHEDRHVLVLCDDNASTNPVTGGEDVRFSSESSRTEEVVHELEREYTVHPSRITLVDYDYLKPKVNLNATLGDEQAEEVFDYPGGYDTPEDGQRYARLMLEAEEAERQLLRGDGNVRRLVPGHWFTLTEHFRRDANAKYLITFVHHVGSAGQYRAWDRSAGLRYENDFYAIPFDTVYRPPRRTPRPLVHGSQTAMVVGPAGEEVYTDSHGRVKVQFYWDRVGGYDEKSSCWIRVSTPWAGKGYGAVSIPRIGNEVVIAFEEGDPDRPLIIGSVYNADQTPPYELPGSGIQMGMKSRSSKGGGGRNEITMTDTKGSEKINIHAQYDMSTTVLHDDTQTVKNDRTVTVEGKHTETIKKDTKIVITEGKYEHEVTAGKAKYGFGSDRTVNVDGEDEFNAAKNSKVNVKLGHDLTSKTAKVTTSEKTTLKTGAATITMEPSQVELKVGGSTVTIDSSSITLTAGGATVKISSAGVKASGTMVELN